MLPHPLNRWISIAFFGPLFDAFASFLRTVVGVEWRLSIALAMNAIAYCNIQRCNIQSTILYPLTDSTGRQEIER